MISVNSVCEVGTIPQIHTRLVREGFHVSEYALRIWVKQGLLPAVFTGNRALISYANAVRISPATRCPSKQTGAGAHTAPAPGILSERI